MKTLSISLPDPLDAYVAEKVSSGGYSSASEVVREGLRLLQQYEHEKVARITGRRQCGNRVVGSRRRLVDRKGAQESQRTKSIDYLSQMILSVEALADLQILKTLSQAIA